MEQSQSLQLFNNSCKSLKRPESEMTPDRWNKGKLQCDITSLTKNRNTARNFCNFWLWITLNFVNISLYASFTFMHHGCVSFILFLKMGYGLQLSRNVQ